MKELLHKYLQIPKPILSVIIAESLLQMVNVSFTILMNFLMLEHGFKDFEITSMVGNRYLTVLLCSLPLGIFIKGRKLKPFLLAGVTLSPIVGLLIIFAIHIHNSELIRLLMAAWGVTFSLFQIVCLPYMLANGNKETETESIALFFQASIITTILVGLTNYLLPKISTTFFSVEHLLLIYTLCSFAAVYFVATLSNTEQIKEKEKTNLYYDYDWDLILRAIIPTFLIAFGAGFTIPFINLFFKAVHGMDADHFSLMNSGAFFLVAFGGFIIPEIKKRYGYRVAITLVQSLAVLALFILGTTEWYAASSIGIWVAVVFYIIRQPLMNVAGPMTSELTMNYVGPRNRELISALNAAIWSGSWFASAQIFAILREAKVAYSNIIFITVVFYIIGVGWYYWLIRDYERKMGEEGVEI